MTQEEIMKRIEDAVCLLGNMAKQMGAKSAVVKIDKDGKYNLSFTAPRSGGLKLIK